MYSQATAKQDVEYVTISLSDSWSKYTNWSGQTGGRSVRKLDDPMQGAMGKRQLTSCCHILRLLGDFFAQKPLCNRLVNMYRCFTLM